MKAIKLFTCVSLVMAGFAVYSPAQSEKLHCKQLNGKIVWTVIAAPNEPFGRVVGSATGILKGATTATILTLTADPTGVLHTHDQDIFVLGPQEILVGEADAVFTPIPEKPGDVSDSQTITFTGGTGRFEGATGSMEVNGFGHDLAGGPGFTYFEVEYKGEVCGPNLN